MKKSVLAIRRCVVSQYPIKALNRSDLARVTQATQVFRI